MKRKTVSADPTIHPVCDVLCAILGKVTCQRRTCACKMLSPEALRARAYAVEVHNAKMYLSEMTVKLHLAARRHHRRMDNLRVMSGALQLWPVIMARLSSSFDGLMTERPVDGSEINEDDPSDDQLPPQILHLRNLTEDLRVLCRFLKPVHEAAEPSVTPETDDQLLMRRGRMKEAMRDLERLMVDPELDPSDLMASLQSSESALLAEAYSFATFLEGEIHQALVKVLVTYTNDGFDRPVELFFE